MFICGFCKKVTPPGMAARKVVVATREVEDKALMIVREEIVKEVAACPVCAAKKKLPVKKEEITHMRKFTHMREHPESVPEAASA